MSHNLRLIASASKQEYQGLRQTRTTTTLRALGRSRTEILLMYSGEVMVDATPDSIESDIEHLNAVLKFCNDNPDYRWSST